MLYQIQSHKMTKENSIKAYNNFVETGQTKLAEAMLEKDKKRKVPYGLDNSKEEIKEVE